MQVISLSGKYIIIICINFEVVFIMNYSLVAWLRFAAIFTATLARILQEPVMNFENYASCFLQSIGQKTKINVFVNSNLYSTLSHAVHIISGGWWQLQWSHWNMIWNVVAPVVQYISIPTDVSCVSSGSYVITVCSAFDVDFFWSDFTPCTNLLFFWQIILLAHYGFMLFIGCNW